MIKKILVMCGGRSPEHEVSIQSVVGILDGLKALGHAFEVVFVTMQCDMVKLNKDMLAEFNELDIVSAGSPCTVMSHAQGKGLVTAADNTEFEFDAVLPIMHGAYGEDGKVQGWLDMLDVPFIGVDVTGSAVCANKILAKKIVAFEQDIDILPFFAYEEGDSYGKAVQKCQSKLLMVKAVNTGSSIGISLVHNEEEYNEAIIDSKRYSDSIIIEKYVPGDDVECAVLDGKVYGIGMVYTKDHYYSYEAKYEDKAEIVFPAKLSQAMEEKIRETSLRIAKVTMSSALCRIDYILFNGEIYFNEINTMPGLTKNISLYPKLLNIYGIDLAKFLDIALNAGIERYNRNRDAKF